jgi:ABC-type transport system involved in multi-copper enzyme maturation permease subunit
VAVNLCSLLVSFGVSTWLPQIVRAAGYDIGSSLTFLVVYNVGAIVGTMVASTVAERIGASYLVLTGFIAAATALALSAVSATPPSTTSPPAAPRSSPRSGSWARTPTARARWDRSFLHMTSATYATVSESQPE